MAKADTRLRIELENRIRFETLIADISARFVKLPSAEVDAEIERALRQIMDFFAVDRCGMMRVTEDKQSVYLTHACYTEGIEEVSKDVDLVELFPYAHSVLVTQGERLRVCRMSDLPPEAKKDQQSWSARGVKSMLCIPLHSTQGLRYLFTIETIHREYEWPEEYIPRVTLLGEIFVNALERRNKDLALKESEARLHLAAESASAGLWTLEVDSGSLWLTEKTRQLFGFASDGEVDFERFLDVVHPDDRRQIQDTVAKALETGEEISVQYRVVRPDGGARWISSHGRAHLDVAGKPNRLMGVSIDITDRKHSEEKLLRSQEALRQLTGKLLTTQEDERRRLARELHDDMTQRLALLAIEVARIEKEAAGHDCAAATMLQAMREKIVKLSADMHSLSRQLHPSILDDLGLADALKSECINFAKREAITIRFEAPDISTHIPKNTAICLYRVTQEALRNIAKHAQSSAAEVSLKHDADHIVLTVKDHGLGFDPAAQHTTAGLGIASMEERVRLIQGDFSIQSQIGRGTVVEVTAPIVERQK